MGVRPGRIYTMKRIFSLFLICVTALTVFGGCSEKSLLDPNDPVNLTLWHVYGEQADAPMNLLVEEFNRTVGRHKGVHVQVTNVTGTSKLLYQLVDALEGKPGALDVPDMFSCHTQNALSLGVDRLTDFGELFTAEELSDYVDEFVESGRVEGKLVSFPVSKSTYALFISGGQFDRFSADTGVGYDDLSTWEGFFDVAEKYYEWSGGKPFCAFDYMIRHLELDRMSKYGEFEYTENGWYDENDPSIKESFDMFANALVRGHAVISDLYANTQVMTGDVLCGIGSTAAVSYYNDTVTYPDNTSEPMTLKVLALPKSGGDNEYMPQTGVGIAAFKTTDKKAEAVYEFVKWFTESDRNLDFAVKTGYMPVTDGAFDAIGNYVFEDKGYESLYSAVKVMHEDYIPVVRPDLDGFYDKTNALYSGLREMLPAMRERSDNGESTDVLCAELWAFFCSID